jgi:hypothetical protein
LTVDFRQGSSYDLAPDMGPFKLVTMGRSFHWMDRAATLATLDGLTTPDAAVALFHDHRIAHSPDWRAVVEPIAEKFSPGRSESRHVRRSADWAPHEAVLLQSRLAEVETLGRVFERQLTADDIVGRVYSMSVTSPEVLGEQREPFEATLRAELAQIAPDHRFTEIVSVEAVLAFRPQVADVSLETRNVGVL